MQSLEQLGPACSRLVPIAGLAFGPAVPTGVIRRAKLNVRLNATKAAAAGTISGLSDLPNRPASNLRTGQGQHHTAYVIYEDAMRHAVANKTPREAAVALADLAAEFLRLPKLETRNQFNRWVIDGLVQSRQILLTAAKAEDDREVVQVVGGQIDELLRYRNGVPGSAASKHDTHGKGEANSAGILREYEKAAEDLDVPQVGEFHANQALTEMWHLLDYDPRTGEDLETVGKTVLTHVQSLQTAYPRTFQWLTKLGPKYHLIPYLRANHKSIPTLGHLSDQQLQQVEEYVHGRIRI